jgi:hypothetical protein
MNSIRIRTVIGLTALLLLLVFHLPMARAQNTFESDWPRRIEMPEGSVVIYQPQPDSLKGDTLTGRAAVSIQREDADEPVFGAIWFSARVSTDRDNRLVTLDDLNVTRVRFADAVEGQEEEFKRITTDSVKEWDTTLSLDRLLTALEAAERERTAASELRNDPPNIVFSNVPAVLISLDGDPELVPVEGTRLLRVVNTPFLIVFDPGTQKYYLKGGGDWLSASRVSGTWQDVQTVPGAVEELFAGMESEDVTTDVTEPIGKPKVIVATEPTELIVVDGAPEFRTIFGTDLLYVSNTERDVFLDTRTQDMYVLLSGRWFRARNTNGPFAYVPSDALPASFAKIPPESVKANILPFVAGTSEATEAVLDAQIPQTAAISKADAKVSVRYDGEPEFADIQGTRMSYATNTTYQVIHAPPKYYCCEDGVWFEAPTANGPWSICAFVPSEIYTIPPSYPDYNVTYVRVYDSTPDVVYVGYTSGYLGCYVYGGSIVWGTGYAYSGWRGGHYCPKPHTYGCAAIYNPFTSRWGFSLFGSGGFVTLHRRGGSRIWWGVGGYRHSDWDWDRRYYDGLRLGITFGRDWDRNDNRDRRDDNRGRSDRERDRDAEDKGSDWRRRENVYSRRSDTIHREQRDGRTREGASRTETPNVTAPTPERPTTPTRPRRQIEERAKRPERNDILTDREGELYRRSLEGWQRRENRDWQRSETTGRQRQRELDRENNARDRGEFRTKRFQDFTESMPSVERSAPSEGRSGRGEQGGRGGAEIRQGGGERGEGGGQESGGGGGQESRGGGGQEGSEGGRQRGGGRGSRR